jgi:hypothetical protein
MDWYTYTTLLLINSAVIVWTFQKCAPIPLFKNSDNQTIINLIGVLIISVWCIGYGFLSENIFIKEISTVIFICTLLSVAVNYRRISDQKTEKNEQNAVIGLDANRTNVVEIDFYRVVRDADKKNLRN